MTGEQQVSLGWSRLLVTGALVLVATVYVTGILVSADRLGLGFDFRFQYYDGATALVEREPLYPERDDAALEWGRAYVYPPPLAAALTPFTALSRDAASVLALVGALAAVLGSLALVGVRDLRCYAVAALSAPVWNVLETANVTALLALALALAWRYRSRVWPVALALGVAISMKMFIWPMTVWVLATRRIGVFLRTMAVAAASLLAAWAAAGFQGMRAYPDLISRLSEIHASHSYSIVGMADALGLGRVVGHVALVVVGSALLALCVAYGRRGDDVRAYTLAVAATLAFTPIMWQHYLCLLLVPLAVARPRFSPLWCLPLLLWIAPRVGHGEGIEPYLPALVAATMLVAMLVAPRPLVVRTREAVA
jgi:hypothetical protein